MKKWVIYYGGLLTVIAVWLFFILPAKILPGPWDLLVGLGVWQDGITSVGKTLE